MLIARAHNFSSPDWSGYYNLHHSHIRNTRQYWCTICTIFASWTLIPNRRRNKQCMPQEPQVIFTKHVVLHCMCVVAQSKYRQAHIDTERRTTNARYYLSIRQRNTQQLLSVWMLLIVVQMRKGIWQWQSAHMDKVYISEYVCNDVYWGRAMSCTWSVQLDRTYV